MTKLDRPHIQNLLESVANTRDAEIDCDDCLAGMAEFAEQQLIGAEIPAALERIAAHIALCPECAEEFEVLLDAIGAASGDAIDENRA